MPLPTRSVASLVDAFPSVSSLALTMRSSSAHHNTTSSRSRPMPPPSAATDDIEDDDDDAPSYVRSPRFNAKSNGKIGLAYRADNTGGGLPLLPSNIAPGTLSGTLGRAVTYSAYDAPPLSPSPDDDDIDDAMTFSSRSGDFNVTRPLT